MWLPSKRTQTEGHLTGGTQWFFSSTVNTSITTHPSSQGKATLLRGFVGEVSEVEVSLDTMSKLRSQLSAKQSW